MWTLGVKNQFFSKKSLIESPHNPFAEIITIGILLFAKNTKKSFTPSRNSTVSQTSACKIFS